MKKKKHRWNGKKKRFGVTMMLPAMAAMLIIQIYPLMTGISYSFTNYRLNRPGKTEAVGLANYIDILTSDTKYYDSLLFSFVNALAVVAIGYVIGMILAIMLNQDIKGRAIFRALLLIPWVVSNTVASTNWLWLLNDRIGFINDILKRVGVIKKSILFLASPQMAKLTVIIVGAWKCIPFMMIILLAGMQSIPGELYESASMDGAGFWSRLLHITLPSLRPVTALCTTLQFIWTFNNFETIYLLTSGGPNEATFVMPIYIYHTSFLRGRIGYGSAVAVLILILMAIFGFARFHISERLAE